MTRIRTARLGIRPWTSADFDDAKKLWGDPRVTALIDARGALTDAQVKERLDREIAREAEHGVSYWKVEDASTLEIVGCAGFRPCDGEGACVLELGFHIVFDRWGKGYATEAARAVIDHAFDVLRVPKLFAGHNPKNDASRRVLERLGFVSIGTRFFEPTGLDHPSYERFPPT